MMNKIDQTLAKLTKREVNQIIKKTSEKGNSTTEPTEIKTIMRMSWITPHS